MESSKNAQVIVFGETGWPKANGWHPGQYFAYKGKKYFVVFPSGVYRLNPMKVEDQGEFDPKEIKARTREVDPNVLLAEMQEALGFLWPVPAGKVLVVTNGGGSRDYRWSDFRTFNAGEMVAPALMNEIQGDHKTGQLLSEGAEAEFVRARSHVTESCNERRFLVKNEGGKAIETLLPPRPPSWLT